MLSTSLGYSKNKFQVQRMTLLKAPVWGGYGCFLTHTQWFLFSLLLHKSSSISWFDQIYERWTGSLTAPSTISVKLLCLFISQLLIYKMKITVLFSKRNLASSQEDTHWLPTLQYSFLNDNNADISLVFCSSPLRIVTAKPNASYRTLKCQGRAWYKYTDMKQHLEMMSLIFQKTNR